MYVYVMLGDYKIVRRIISVKYYVYNIKAYMSISYIHLHKYIDMYIINAITTVLYLFESIVITRSCLIDQQRS